MGSAGNKGKPSRELKLSFSSQQLRSQPSVIMSENSCIFCAKPSQSLLQCSGCGSVQYCDKTCQRSHWKNHKRDCKPYRVCEIAGKNKGIVATRTIKQGQVILRDQPLLILKKSDIRDKRNILAKQFQILPPKDQKTVLSLHHVGPDVESEADRVVDVFDCNGIEVVPVQSICLYSTIPRINHSCRPNVVWSWLRGATTSKEVRATTDIRPGQELSANYIDSFEATWSSRVQRQKRLSLWKFSCQCEVCSLEGEDLRSNDAIREEISLQHQLIPKYMANWNIVKAVASAERKLHLVKVLEGEMKTLLPSSLLELYEMYRLALTLNVKVPQDIEVFKEEARLLSDQFGERFVNVFHEKLDQIEEECDQVRKARK